MSWWQPLLIAGVGLYAAFVIALAAADRRRDARALAGFIADCIVLFRRLLRDDAIIVALALRSVLRAGGTQLLRDHWPGPPASLNVVKFRLDES